MEAVTTGFVASSGSAKASGTMINLQGFASTPLVHDPYDHMVVQDFVRPEWQQIIAKDFPQIDKAGSFPLATLSYGPEFARFIAELEGETFRHYVEEKFGLDLTGRPTMVTVRGQTDETDGRIHTDSRTKIITMLVYFNESWANQGGKLRLLRSATDLEDYAAEVEPRIGTLIAFRRSENSWHGHHPYVGPRRAIQLNWVVSDAVKRREQKRHKVSAFFKKLFGVYAG
ncbi:MAG: 2OG-Fe(II) oxygenase [Thiobacillaceae bacterium]